MSCTKACTQIDLSTLRIMLIVILLNVGLSSCGEELPIRDHPNNHNTYIGYHEPSDTSHSYLVAFKNIHHSSSADPLHKIDHSVVRSQIQTYLGSMIKPHKNALKNQSSTDQHHHHHSHHFLTNFPVYPSIFNPTGTWSQIYGPMITGGTFASHNRLFGGSSSPEALIAEMNFRSDDHARTTLAQLAAQSKIWFAEPNQSHRLSNDDDPSYSSIYTTASEILYHINMIRLREAISFLESSSQWPQKRPIIAIMDSGIDVHHQALRHKIIDLHKQSWPHARACPQDQYGCNTAAPASAESLGQGDVYPIGTSNFGTRCPGISLNLNSQMSYREITERSQYCQHGTLVAGLAAGYSDLVYGACPHCDLIPIKIVDKNLKISDSSILRALEYASLIKLKDGRTVDVINVSLGKTSKSLSVAILIRQLSQQNNILFVGAAGNDNTTAREYPGALHDVMAVSALNLNSQKIPQSNYGGWVSVSAPGYYLLSSTPGGEVKYDHGTSMATPLVAGVAGLVLSAASQPLSSKQLKTLLETTANSSKLYTRNPEYKLNSADPTLKSGSLGWGVVDALAAVQKATQMNPHSPTPPDHQPRIGGCAAVTTTTIPAESSGVRTLVALLIILMTFITFISINLITDTSLIRSRHSPQ